MVLGRLPREKYASQQEQIVSYFKSKNGKRKTFSTNVCKCKETDPGGYLISDKKLVKVSD